MAFANDTLPGRTGPYWRRQQHRTLPGEFTAEQLNKINMLRQRQGQPAVGGAVGFNTRQAMAMAQQPGFAQRLAQPGAAAGHHPEDVDPGNQIIPPLERPENGFIGGQYMGPQDRGALQGRNVAGLRDRLLASVMGQGVPPTSRDALRQFVNQAGLRRAKAGPVKPILPQRQSPLRRAVARHPY